MNKVVKAVYEHIKSVALYMYLGAGVFSIAFFGWIALLIATNFLISTTPFFVYGVSNSYVVDIVVFAVCMTIIGSACTKSRIKKTEASE